MNLVNETNGCRHSKGPTFGRIYRRRHVNVTHFKAIIMNTYSSVMIDRKMHDKPNTYTKTNFAKEHLVNQSEIIEEKQLAAIFLCQSIVSNIKQVKRCC